MKTYLPLLPLLLLAFSSLAQNKVPAKEVQLKSAVLAAPADKRAEATVWGYSAEGKRVLLRKGTNEMVCLGDNPLQEGFSVSCYHRDLEPFMERGRALKEEGRAYQEIFDIREQEVQSGRLKMPEQPATLYVYSAAAEDFNESSGEVSNGKFRYVVYIPYATPESTGLPLQPEAPGMPWIMDPGTHRAHIMITPPDKE